MRKIEKNGKGGGTRPLAREVWGVVFLFLGLFTLLALDLI